MATTAAKSEPVPAHLPTTREQRGRQIAKLGGIRQLGARYVVPSQSANSNVPTYLVDLVEQTCTCPDYATRLAACKHQEAVMFWLVWEAGVSGIENPPTETTKAPKRPTYPRNNAAINRAHTTEKERVAVLLKGLCEGIEQPPREPGKRGRNAYCIRDVIFWIIMKVFTTLSGRRAKSDIRTCKERQQIGKVYAVSTMFRAMLEESTTEILLYLLEASAAPLAVIENRLGQFAADSTGFHTRVFERWFSHKHGKVKAEHPFMKLHIMVGTETHVVTGARVSNAADCPQLPELLDMTTKQFVVREVSADKAYLSKKNLEAINKAGATPFIPFKENSVGMASKSEHWRKMWCHFTLKADDFAKRYHRRSNVETVMHMVKAKFGAAVRAKTPRAQINEILAKLICHNLACIVQAIEEHGIQVDFGPSVSTTPMDLDTTLVES